MHPCAHSTIFQKSEPQNHFGSYTTPVHTIERMLKPIEITLRPFKIADVDDFMAWAGDDNVTRYCRWDTYTARDDALDFLGEVIKSHPWYRAICIKDHPIGSIYVMPGIGKDQRRGEIGYALSAKYWGKGIATEAVKMAVSCVFKELKYLDRVEGLVYAENKPSQRVLEKAGFIKEGLLRKYFFVKGKSRDIIVFSIVDADQEELDFFLTQAND